MKKESSWILAMITLIVASKYFFKISNSLDAQAIVITILAVGYFLCKAIEKLKP